MNENVLTPGDFAGRRRNDRRIACRPFCGWCSCRSSSAVHDSASRSSSWACSCGCPTAGPLHPDRTVWTPIRRPSTRWSSGTTCPSAVPARTATTGSVLNPWNTDRILEVHLFVAQKKLKNFGHSERCGCADYLDKRPTWRPGWLAWIPVIPWWDCGCAVRYGHWGRGRVACAASRDCGCSCRPDADAVDGPILDC